MRYPPGAMETITPLPLTPERPSALDEKSLNAYRRLGFLLADLDPMNRLPPATAPGLEDCDPVTAEYAHRCYCGTVGVEFMHIGDPVRRRWIQQRMESEPSAPADRDRILELLTRADTFEQFIQSRYLGTKRFSIEGIESLLPLLDEMLEGAATHRTSQVVVAMSHRGRLNVMVHTVGRGPAEIFAGFEDVDPRSILGGGDVKYHMGATGDHQGRNGHTVNIHLVSNPSHLEAVDPVALGRVRAKQVRLGDEKNHDVVFPIVLHGDAAFAGQGILAETLNMSDLHGYRVGGTVHVIVNNLIGFTTEPKALQSSRFASDVARRIPIPIFHVNGEDPDAVARVAQMAVDYRYAFKSDVVVDLIGFRRHGHSEVDDPTITQPLLYKKIQVHPPAWRLYAKAIGLADEEAQAREAAIRAGFDAAHKEAATDKALDRPTLRTLPDYWDPFKGGRWRPEYEVTTGLPAAEIAALTVPLTTAPEGFHVHKKIQALLQQRAEMGNGKRPIDYGMAEALAFASLAKAGVPVRLSGQDSRRGTFNQRHSVLIDVEDASEYTPLEHVAANQARFEVYDSMLSEAAVLGFEYGYGRDFPETLVCWEAQFGDFANGAQIIVDQFITAGEDKWGLLSAVVMLLPHGYEGQGPEHSSARMERYLQLCGEHNVQVCQPSNAAQYFHMLRRQALTPWRKPLIVMTPKSMLRHKDSASTLEDLARDRFQRVVPDSGIHDAQRILLCTGKIGHELKREREKRQDTSIAVVFLDQLYPFPAEELTAVFEQNPKARDIVWVQEEPANMGALSFIQPRIERLLRRPIRSVKRSASGSPATGSGKAHVMEQQTLLALALTTGR
ncbi:MAG TPA: 2-oxoglutarate dehydrogenase E1 component [Thermoanaerobaculia bacterium]|nr:2-oxoglutarate dehydrogenase E1 component [Thermoanaerobaculia bacterium]